MKTKLLIAAVMFFGLSVAVFAQATYTVGSIPVTQVVDTGYTEKTGDITFTTIPTSGVTVRGTISIQYPVAITFNGFVDVPVPAVGNAPAITVQGPLQGTAYNEIVLTIIPAAVNPAQFYTFRVTGVRVSIAGDTGAADNMQAQLSAVGNGVVVNQERPLVIKTAKPGLQSFTGTVPVRINDITGALALPPSNVTLTGLEGFRNAFGVTAATDPTQTVSTMIKISLDQALPAGVTVSFPAVDNSAHFVTANKNGGVLNSVVNLTSASGSSPAVYYRVVTDTDQTVVESFVISITVAATAATSGAYPDVTIKATASFAPIQQEIGNSAAIPRYMESPVGSVPIITFFHPTTTLLVPYAVSTLGYDTGLAISNTTADPGILAMGYTSAILQDGTFKFYLYSSGGTPYIVSSVDMQAKGILVNGKLPTGKTYPILLSELLRLAGAPADFSGYAFVITQFTNAHGQYFIADFDHFTSGALMLVIGSSRDAMTFAEQLNN